HRADARVPPARPDRDRCRAAASRPVEPARRVRPRGARQAPLGRARAVRVARVRPADRGPAARTRADAALAAFDAVLPRTLGAGVRGRQRSVQALRTAGARAPRAAALARARGPRIGRAARPSLVRGAARRADADRSPSLRRGCDRGPTGTAAALGPCGTLVSGDAHRAAPGRRANPRRASLQGARRARDPSGTRGAPGGERRARAPPCGAPLPLRPARPRPRPRRGSVGVLLPAREVRPAGEARVRLLRPAAAQGRPADRPDRARLRPAGEDARRQGALGRTGRPEGRRARDPRRARPARGLARRGDRRDRPQRAPCLGRRAARSPTAGVAPPARDYDSVMDFATRAIHAGQEPDPATGAVTTPIYQTSTFVQEAVGVHKGYDYARVANPTRTALEECLASLENAAHGHAFSSGIGATTTIMHLVDPGDRVVCVNDVY